MELLKCLQRVFNEMQSIQVIRTHRKIDIKVKIWVRMVIALQIFLKEKKQWEKIYWNVNEKILSGLIMKT